MPVEYLASCSEDKTKAINLFLYYYEAYYNSSLQNRQIQKIVAIDSHFSFIFFLFSFSLQKILS